MVLVVDGSARSVKTQAQTVERLLLSERVQLEPEDALSDSPDALLYAGMTVTVARARDVDSGGGWRAAHAADAAENPLDILEKAGLGLRSLDRIWLDGTEAEAEELAIWLLPVLELMACGGGAHSG